MAYNPDFITGYSIQLPGIPKSKKKEVATLLKGSGFLLNYEHHSVIMNKKRKFAFFSASNIDGDDWKNIERKGTFKKDDAIAASSQAGNELYNAIKASNGRPNDFEQGHLTSFQEVTWGKTTAERKHAAADTFYFTNCVPQHERLNVGLWRSLEQYVLKTQTITHGLSVSVITGPLLADNDPYYIKKIDNQFLQIPCVFWKVVYYPNKNGLNAAGFMMSQSQLLQQDGTVTSAKSGVRSIAASTQDLFMDYKYDAVYQVRVELIQKISGLKFMLDNVNLPYQVKTPTDLLFKRIEVPPSRTITPEKTVGPALDYTLEGITL
ncbi:MAG: DNA/RNA non-specific endonuclease [Chitinophagaceae bacterium]